MFDNVSIYSKFLLNYLNKLFLTDVIKILMYTSPLIKNIENQNLFVSINNFIDLLNKDLNENPNLDIPIKHYQNLLKVIKEILKLKEDSNYNFLNSENIETYFNNIDERFIVNIFENVSNNPITDDNQFNNIYNKIIRDINIYNQMQVIKGTIQKWNLFLDQSEDDTDNNISAINWVKNFKDTIQDANSNLELIKDVELNNRKDYMLFSDENSIDESLVGLVEFLKSSYSCYKTGYDLLDDNTSGIESSSVMVITGPSNHAKSILMLNFAKAIMENNDDNIENAHLFITLEDDINKLFRRVVSIFGNFDSLTVKNMFIQFSDLLQSDNSEVSNKVNDILKEIIKESVFKITKGKKTFIIKHNPENSFSMDDATKFIDHLKKQNIFVKSVFIDYIDVMTPSHLKVNNQYATDEYLAQGEIVTEMRTVSRNYGIPIVTITQNNRGAENYQVEMSNALIGDSYKKIRYSEVIIMIRQRPDLDIFAQQVMADIKINKTLDELGDLLKFLVPFEIKITKVKDGGGKDMSRFHIFNTKNLRIYQSFDKLITDMTECADKSKKLNEKLNIISIPATSSFDFEEESFDNILGD